MIIIVLLILCLINGNFDSNATSGDILIIGLLLWGSILIHS